MRPLREHAVSQRLSTLEEILESDGDVAVTDRRSPSRRYVRILVLAPGWDLPRLATFEYEEWYTLTARGWSATAYQYEVRLERRAGRKAYHWHDGSHHFHCEDLGSQAHEHYRGYAVDLLDDARPDFLRIAASGRVDCSGLHPLRAPGR